MDEKKTDIEEKKTDIKIVKKTKPNVVKNSSWMSITSK